MPLELRGLVSSFPALDDADHSYLTAKIMAWEVAEREAAKIGSDRAGRVCSWRAMDPPCQLMPQHVRRERIMTNRPSKS